VVLTTDGATAHRQVGKDRGVEVRAVPANPRGRPRPNHINNVNAYDRRLKKRMDLPRRRHQIPPQPSMAPLAGFTRAAKAKLFLKTRLADVGKKPIK
jgi:hypothetical protein